jgi:hypothetical protein
MGLLLVGAVAVARPAPGALSVVTLAHGVGNVGINVWCRVEWSSVEWSGVVCLSEGRKVAFAERRLLMISKVRDGIRTRAGSYIRMEHFRFAFAIMVPVRRIGSESTQPRREYLKLAKAGHITPELAPPIPLLRSRTPSTHHSLLRFPL